MAKLSSLGDPDIIKISALPPLSGSGVLDGTELLMVVHGGITERTTVADLFRWSMSIGTAPAPKTTTWIPNATSAEITISNGGMNFNRTNITDAAQIRWNRGGNEIWGYGFDWISDDLVIAYDGLTNKDVMRFSIGGKLKIGLASSPINSAANLTLTSHAANGTTGILGIVSETSSGNTGTPFLFFMLNNGHVAVGASDAPTAWLHLPAVTIAASSAPIKFTPGTLMTAAENGAVEYDGIHLYITIGGVRKQLD